MLPVCGWLVSGPSVSVPGDILGGSEGSGGWPGPFQDGEVMANYETARDTLESPKRWHSISDMPRTGSRHLLRTSGVEVFVTRKRMKNLRMRVDPRDASVQLSAPHHADEAEIAAFVARNLEWVVEAQTRARMNVPERLVSGGRARLWGQWRELVVSDGGRSTAHVEDGRIHIVRPDGDEEAARRALTALHRRELLPAVEHFLDVHSPYVGRRPSHVRLARMRSRWGSCNHVTGRMSFNVALAERPQTELEYVVVHELGHLLEANHGPAFKQHLTAMLPDWRSRDAGLKGRL